MAVLAKRMGPGVEGFRGLHCAGSHWACQEVKQEVNFWRLVHPNGGFATCQLVETKAGLEPRPKPYNHRH